MSGLTSDQLEEMFNEMAEYALPPNKIFISERTHQMLITGLSRLRTKQNREARKQRRRAMGRGRW